MGTFATTKNQFSGNGRYAIVLGACDGSDKKHTIEQQLIDFGVMDKKWSHRSDNVPGSIFYWFTHVAAPAYSISKWTTDVPGNCGICYTSIEHKYYYVLNGDPKVNLNEKYDVILPREVTTGSECINLTKQMKNLLKNLDEKGMVSGSLRFTRGRILARDIINSFSTWKVDTIALPLQWFYFENWWRPLFMLGQDNMGYGYHSTYEGTDSVWTNMKLAARKERIIRAFELFRGEDEFHEPVTIYTHGRQVADADKYVVLTRHSAMNLSWEISRKKANLINKGIFKDDK